MIFRIKRRPRAWSAPDLQCSSEKVKNTMNLCPKNCVFSALMCEILSEIIAKEELGDIPLKGSGCFFEHKLRNGKGGMAQALGHRREMISKRNEMKEARHADKEEKTAKNLNANRRLGWPLED